MQLLKFVFFHIKPPPKIPLLIVKFLQSKTALFADTGRPKKEKDFELTSIYSFMFYRAVFLFNINNLQTNITTFSLQYTIFNL